MVTMEYHTNVEKNMEDTVNNIYVLRVLQASPH